MGKLDPTVRRDAERIVVARWFRTGPATLEVTARGGQLQVRAWGEGAESALAASGPMLGLHDAVVVDFGDARVNKLVRPVVGTRLSRMPSAAHELLCHVLQQQIAWRDAARTWKSLVSNHGAAAPGPFGLQLPLSFEQQHRLPHHAYQAAGVIESRIATLREIGRLGYRIDDWLAESVEVFTRRLQSLPRMGPWTTNHVLAVAMGEPDILIPGDYTLPHTVAWALRRQPRGTDQQMVDLLEPFRGNRWRLVRLLWALNISAPRRGPRLGSAHTRRW